MSILESIKAIPPLHLFLMTFKCIMEFLFAIFQCIYQNFFIISDDYNKNLLKNANMNLLSNLYIGIMPFIYTIFFHNQNAILNQSMVFLILLPFTWINTPWFVFILGILELCFKYLILPATIYSLNRYSKWKFISITSICYFSFEIAACFLMPHFINFFTDSSELNLKILKNRNDVITRSFRYIMYPIKIGFNIILYNKKFKTPFIESFIGHELGHLHYRISDTLIGILTRLSIPLFIMIFMIVMNRSKRQSRQKDKNSTIKINLLDYYASFALCWLIWIPLSNGILWMMEWRADSYASQVLKLKLDFLKEQPTINHFIIQLWRNSHPPSYTRE